MQQQSNRGGKEMKIHERKKHHSAIQKNKDSIPFFFKTQTGFI
jgi:hypothetical protein